MPSPECDLPVISRKGDRIGYGGLRISHTLIRLLISDNYLAPSWVCQVLYKSPERFRSPFGMRLTIVQFNKLYVSVLCYLAVFQIVQIKDRSIHQVTVARFVCGASMFSSGPVWEMATASLLLFWLNW